MAAVFAIVLDNGELAVLKLFNRSFKHAELVAMHRCLAVVAAHGFPVPRQRSERDYRDFVPVHVVWELTLACNLKCSHCGSRAGKRRPDELTTAEALAVVDQLARLGTRELTIIGGLTSRLW